MIEARIKEGDMEKLIVSGNLQAVCADVICLIRAVRDAIKEGDKEASELFEFLIEKCFESGIVFATEDEAKDIFDKVDDLKKVDK